MPETWPPAEIKAPSLRLLLGEARVALAWPAFQRATRLLDGLPRGDGHAVLMVPGFGTTNRMTRPLRSALQRLGYAVEGWECGRNLGMRPTVRASLNNQIERLYRQHGPVSLVGWSLGGIFVREAARHHPLWVREVITLGSPFSGYPTANNLHTLLRIANGGRRPEIDWARFHRHQQPPAVPCHALHTRADGIVNWRCCLEPETPRTCNIEVGGSHLTLVLSLEVLRTVADILATPSAPPGPAH
ncbi:MAG: alpha/beta hydrolase [Nevskiaceae bacterium]|nr:MAG: alpha/beta hydrolase [Nevskiaceae bacterium]TBR73317.1 MAG: alpha/beta hydrolase [Nevskiaceae bacterium]